MPMHKIQPYTPSPFLEITKPLKNGTYIESRKITRVLGVCLSFVCETQTQIDCIRFFYPTIWKYQCTNTTIQAIIIAETPKPLN